MRVAITARHMELTQGLKDHVQQQLEKLRHHFDRIIDAEVVLSVEKHRHIADVTLNANGLRIHGKESSEDMYTSIDAVTAKLDKQIGKHKKRIKRWKARDVAPAGGYSHSFIEMENEAEGEDLPENSELVGHKVVQHETLPMTPMTVEEAVMQLDLTDDLFLVFANAETQKVNVIYGHRDGTYGLIEPQF